MSFPATRHALPDVGAARDQRPRAATCTYTQVHRLLRCGEFDQRQVRLCLKPRLQCTDIRAVSRALAAQTYKGQAHADRSGQRPISPCKTSQTISAPIPQGVDTGISAALQPATGAYRAGVEAHPPYGDSQSAFPDAKRSARCGSRMLCAVAQTKFSSETIMRRYLSRYV